MSSTKSEADTRVPVIEISRIHSNLPYFQSVPAGFPSPADDYVEEKLSNNIEVAVPNAGTYQSYRGGGTVYGEEKSQCPMSAHITPTPRAMALLRSILVAVPNVGTHNSYA